MHYSDGPFPVGSLVWWGEGEAFGIATSIDRLTVTVGLDTGSTMVFTLASSVIERVCFEPGDPVQQPGAPVTGVVMASVPSSAQPLWQVSFPSGTRTLPEMAVRPAITRDPVERFKAGDLGSARDSNLKSVAADMWLQHLHNPLVSLAHSRVDLKPHQVSVVHRVISGYPHRFMLCDEVGLGKTIEAAMVIKELRARKQAARVLILVPSGLMRQWQFELKTKFNETFSVINSVTVKFLENEGVENPWTHRESVISSHTWSSWTEQRRDEIARTDWDLIIVDEAHHARKQQDGSRTNLYRLVNDLTARPEFSRRAVLFLTATPMQLQRHELYSLVEMVDPVLFSSEDDFVAHIENLSGLNRTVESIDKFGIPVDDEELDGLVSEVARFTGVARSAARRRINKSEAGELAEFLRSRHRLSEVMIRNRRSKIGGFQPRSAFRWEVELSPLEIQVKDLMDEIFEEGYLLAARTGQHSLGFLMTTFQKLAASSSRALETSLKRRRDRLLAGATKTVRELSESDAGELLDDDELVSTVAARMALGAKLEVVRFEDVVNLLQKIDMDSKARVLTQKLGDIFSVDRDAKVLIFTQFRETQAMLEEVLMELGWGVHKFHGQMDALKKDRSVELFREGAGPQILVSTEAGGEGRNFQFCHYLVNYDLPWNPMKVEQRIGRVDRIGQEHPVIVFNFHVKDTIESRILDVLERRIGLFEEAVGGLEPILGETEGDIRRALQLSAEARDRELERIGRDTERRVRQARDAEEKLGDFILDAKSYRSEIVRTAIGEVTPVVQTDFERYLTELLTSVGTRVGGPNKRGEWKVTFNPPFSLERPDLIDGRPRRRVCFNPQLNVDSEFVEYFGFGHPLVDELTRQARIEDLRGTAAVRRIVCSEVESPGWQFNWRVKVGAIRPRAMVFAVFVADDGAVSREIGEQLLRRSRSFAFEDVVGTSPSMPIDTAYELATAAVAEFAAEQQAEQTEHASQRAATEERRINALYERRMQAAQDRIESCAATLSRMKESEEEGPRKAIPMWEGNLVRAQAELEQIRSDREEMLEDLNLRRMPTYEFDLVNVAGIVCDDFRVDTGDG